MTATTNPILCKELSATVCKIETVATQLRIIVAVKAADPGDKDKGMQVVKCCANLVDGLIACLGHSRAIQKASKGGRCK